MIRGDKAEQSRILKRDVRPMKTGLVQLHRNYQGEALARDLDRLGRIIAALEEFENS